MSTANTHESIIKEINKYNKEEFDYLIDIIDNKELIKPIKKNSKKFIQDTKGWRIDKLDKNKLKEIYSKYVYNKINIILCTHFVILIKENARTLMQLLESKSIDVDEIPTEIENNKDHIDKIIDILLDSQYHRDTLLPFKLMDIELDENSISYIIDTTRVKKFMKVEKEKEINNITEEFNLKLKEQEKKLNDNIKNKEKGIKELKSKIDSINKKHAIEIEHKDIEIHKLKDNITSKENKFNNELNKLNCKIKNLEENLDQYEAINKDIKQLIDKKEEQINALLKLLEEEYKAFEEYANSRWKNENEDLELKNRELSQNINELEEYKQYIEEEVLILKKDKEYIEKSINSLEDKSKEFITDISYIMDRVKNYEVNKPSINNLNYDLSSNIHHVKSIVVEKSPDVKEELYDFIDDLADNFECIGVGIDYKYDLAKYVYATIANKMGLFIMGYNNRLFANAISYTVSNSSADIIVIQPGFTDSKLLIDTIKHMESKVVIIENAIDNISESVYMALIKENKDKILIFSTESNENLNIIPKSVFNYLMVVDLDSILVRDQIDELYACITPDEIFEIDKDNKIKRKKLVKNLSDIVELSNISKLKMLEINNIINNLNSEDKSKDGVYSLLLFSLLRISKTQNKYEHIEEFIKEQNFDNKKLDILNYIIEMEKDYE